MHVSLCDVRRVSCVVEKETVTRKWSIGRRCADARAAAQRQRDAAPHRCAKKRAVERQILRSKDKWSGFVLPYSINTKEAKI